MSLHLESPGVEMGAAAGSGWRGQKPVKSRRRILCPVLPSQAERPREFREAACRVVGTPPARCVPTERPSLDLPVSAPCHSRPVSVTVRVLYFSRDGGQADNGAAYEFHVSTSTFVEELLNKARSAAGVENGQLLFKMRPLKAMRSTLGENGVVAEPKAFHLMLSRKQRPAEVVAQAEVEAEKLAEHTAAAAMSAPPRRQKAPRPPSSSGCSMDDPMDESVQSLGSIAA